MHEKPIPNNIKEICRLIMLNEYSTDVERMLNEFFVLVETGWINNRTFVEITHFHSKKDGASKAGKASAEKRKLKKDLFNNHDIATDDQQTFNERSTDVQPTNNYKPITNNHKPVLKEKINKKETENLFHDVSEQTAIDFKKLRSAKKAPVTGRVIESIRSEATKAGISLETALIECCTRGWTSFKADWYHKTHSPPAYQTKQQLATIAARSIFGNETQERVINGEVIEHGTIAKQLG